jgi:hypothetical protein
MGFADVLAKSFPAMPSASLTPYPRFRWAGSWGVGTEFWVAMAGLM